MRRVIVSFVAVGAVAVLAAGVAPAKSGQGVMCVLHAKLTAKNETTGSTSTAKGHTQIKVRNDGRIQFKTTILNPSGETFVAGHVHLAPAGVAGAVVVPDDRSPHQATRRRYAERRHDGSGSLREPERLLRQLPHDRVPRRGDSRPAALTSRPTA